jgi:hypothetical protein
VLPFGVSTNSSPLFLVYIAKKERVTTPMVRAVTSISSSFTRWR